MDDFSGKKLHRLVGMDRVVTSESLGGEMIRTFVHNAADVGSTLTLGAVHTIFIIPMTLLIHIQYHMNDYVEKVTSCFSHYYAT